MNPIVVPSIIPYIIPLKELRLYFMLARSLSSTCIISGLRSYVGVNDLKKVPLGTSGMQEYDKGGLGLRIYYHYLKVVVFLCVGVTLVLKF